MDRLKEILQNIWAKIVSLLQNFEKSSAFERIMRRYDSMTPRGQGIFKGLLKLGTFIFAAFIILGGPFILLSKINRIKELEKLESNALVFQAEYEAQTRGYSAPAGWRPLAANSASELAAAFNEYLPGIGVPEEFGTLVANGDTLNLTLREISIRQATNIIFQLEGLYPKVRTSSLTVRPNAGQREILDMEASFKFNAAFSNQVSGAPPEMPDQSEFDDIAAPPSPSGRATPSHSGAAGADNPSGTHTDFQNDYVPPPPPGGEYDDMAPPDLPDDLPPPPPPPGFEEEP